MILSNITLIQRFSTFSDRDLFLGSGKVSVSHPLLGCEVKNLCSDSYICDALRGVLDVPVLLAPLGAVDKLEVVAPQLG